MSDIQIENANIKQASVKQATVPPNEATADQAKPDKGPSGGLVVYRATRAEEVANLRSIALEYHAESRYSHLTFSDEKLIRVYTRAISNPKDILVLYVRYKGETLGMLHAGAGDYYLGVGGKMVTLYAVYVTGKIRNTYMGGKIGVKLMRLLSEWAKSQDAEEIYIHSTSGIEPQRTDKMLTRMGFETIGGNYVARLV